MNESIESSCIRTCTSGSYYMYQVVIICLKIAKCFVLRNTTVCSVGKGRVDFTGRFHETKPTPLESSLFLGWDAYVYCHVTPSPCWSADHLGYPPGGGQTDFHRDVAWEKSFLIHSTEKKSNYQNRPPRLGPVITSAHERTGWLNSNGGQKTSWAAPRLNFQFWTPKLRSP